MRTPRTDRDHTPWPARVRTTNETTVVINSVERAEMDGNHTALDELLN
jgi:hypothetical protein